MVRVGINGFGRIGRAFFRAAMNDPEVEIVGINDLGDASNLAYLLKYDSVYPALEGAVKAENGQLVVGDKHIHFVSEKDPSKLPWGSLSVDVAIESTGVFATYEKGERASHRRGEACGHQCAGKR
jgi:glyceraldehyde 3-phosphate dehydrogenase